MVTLTSQTAPAPAANQVPVTNAAANQDPFVPAGCNSKNAVEREPAVAILLVGHGGQVVYRKAFGSRALDPKPEPMTVDTIFDKASLTKAVATTSCVMRMVQLGQIKLNDPVVKYIPEFGRSGKEEVTVRQLLTHYSGLRPDLDLKPYRQASKKATAAPTPRSLSIRRGQSSFIATSILWCWGNWCSGSAACPWTSMRRRTLPAAWHEREAFSSAQAWSPRIAPTQPDERTGQMLRGTVPIPRRARWEALPAMLDCSPRPMTSPSLPRCCSTAARLFSLRGSWRR